jgi:hypothetical protein
MNARACIGAALVGVCCVAVPARAQYYESHEYRPADFRAITGGLTSLEFRPRASGPATDSTGIRFHTLMPILSFRQGLVEIQAGYSRFSQNDLTQPVVFVGMNVGTDVPLVGERSSALVLPVVFSANFTRADAPGPTRNSFNIASVGLGMGLKYRMVHQTLDAWISTVAIAHYATEGFSVNSGFSAAFVGDLVLFFPEIPVGDGLCVGYRFRYETWSMPGTDFDYRMLFHGPYLGIAF